MAASQVSSPNPSALGDLLPSVPLGGLRAEAFELRDLLGAIFNAAERCVDMAAIIAAVYCAWALYRLLGLGSQVQVQAPTVLLSAAGFALLFVILLERRGGYRPYVSLLAVRETERILRVTIESFLLALLVAYFTTEHISRLVALIALVTVPVFVMVGKWELRNGLRLLRAKGYGTRRAVIVGAGTLGRRIYSALARSPSLGSIRWHSWTMIRKGTDWRFTNLRISESEPPKCWPGQSAPSCYENWTPVCWSSQRRGQIASRWSGWPLRRAWTPIAFGKTFLSRASGLTTPTLTGSRWHTSRKARRGSQATLPSERLTWPFLRLFCSCWQCR